MKVIIKLFVNNKNQTRYLTKIKINKKYVKIYKFMLCMYLN